MPAKLDQDARPDEKLLKLYSLLLFTGKEYSLTELKDKLMCSKQTIGRLVDKLEKSYYGSIVVKKKGKENFYGLKKPSTSKGMHVSINPDGLRKMILCSDLMCIYSLTKHEIKLKLQLCKLRQTSLLKSFLSLTMFTMAIALPKVRSIMMSATLN